MNPDPKVPWDYPAPPEMAIALSMKRALLVEGKPPRDPVQAEEYHRLEREIESTDYFMTRRHAQMLALHSPWEVRENGGWSVACLEHPEGGLALRISRQRTSQAIDYRWVASEQEIPGILDRLRGKAEPQEDRLVTAFRGFDRTLKGWGCSPEDIAKHTTAVFEGLGIANYAQGALAPADRERVILVFEHVVRINHRRPQPDQIEGEIAFQTSRVR